MPGQAADAPGHDPVEEDERGQDEQGQAGDLRAQHEHRDQRRHQGEDVGDDRRRRADGVLGVEHVVGQPAHERPGLRAGEERHRHALHVGVQLDPQVVDDALADHRPEPAVDKRQGGGGQGQPDHGGGQHVDLGHPAVVGEGVDKRSTSSGGTDPMAAAALMASR